MRAVLERTGTVALLYLVLTVVMTWPLSAGIDRDLPGDLGDPAFVAGIMAWGSKQWLSLVSGDLGAAARFWDAPIFSPEPLATAYSEHFAFHSLLTLPIYAVTRNPLLCYNVAFLSTFVLSGLGMYLLVRELTRRPAAAFVAGLAFAFAPHRMASLVHLQVLSSQWMPFALFGLRRYFERGSSDALLGTGAALWAQNLSSGYFMLFFSPFVALYVVTEMSTRRLLMNVRVWRDVIVTVSVAIIATLPFAMPYLLRRASARRPMYEVVFYSADLRAWVTAHPSLNLWGHLQTLPKAEGFLFPGLTVVILALLGLARVWRGRSLTEPERQGLLVAGLFGALALALSFWLSLGPQIQNDTQPTGFPALYRLLWEYVPGFSAARVPARFATMTVLALALLAGAGSVWLDRGRRRWALAICGLLIVAEGSALPLRVNGMWTSAEELYPPEARLYRLVDAPAVYRYLARLDGPVVVAHLPFGLTEHEIQYGYYAALHGKRTVNGYSGGFPPSYQTRLPVLRSPFVNPELLQSILDVDRVTHVVVHTAAWKNNNGWRVLELFDRAGWKRTAVFGTDHVFTR